MERNQTRKENLAFADDLKGESQWWLTDDRAAQRHGPWGHREANSYGGMSSVFYWVSAPRGEERLGGWSLAMQSPRNDLPKPRRLFYFSSWTVLSSLKHLLSLFSHALDFISLLGSSICIELTGSALQSWNILLSSDFPITRPMALLSCVLSLIGAGAPVL